MKNHNIEFLIEQRKEGYEILGKMPWIGIRRYLTLPLETCLNLNKLECLKLLIESKEKFQSKIYINNECILFENREIAEELLEFVNSIYILNKLTK